MFLFFKQKTAYEMRISDWSSDVCSSDLSAPWEPQLLGDFTATPVPASDGYGDVQMSWVVSAGGRRIFHGGDTLWHGHWWRIGRQFGPFDAAFLPVNGARFGWRKPVSGLPGVLNPKPAVGIGRAHLGNPV